MLFYEDYRNIFLERIKTERQDKTNPSLLTSLAQLL
jgi:hypothetical protein